MNSVRRILALIIAILMALGTLGGALLLLAEPAYAEELMEGRITGWSSSNIKARLPGEQDYLQGADRVNNSNLVYQVSDVQLLFYSNTSIGFSDVSSIVKIEYGSGGNFEGDTPAVGRDVIINTSSSSNNTLNVTFNNLKYDRQGKNLVLKVYYKDSRKGGDQSVGQLVLEADFAEPNPNYVGNGGSSDNADDPLRVLTPRVLIDRYDKTAGSVEPESQFTLNIRYVTPSNLLLKNTLMEVQAPTGVSILNSSNKVYIETISDVNPGSSNFTFIVGKDYEADTVPITVNFEFEYWLNDDYVKGTSSEILSLPVVGKGDDKADRFELSTLELPENLYVGEEGWLTLNVINKGKEQVSNVTVTLEGDNVSNTGYSEYHGAVASNTKAEIELPISMRVGGDSLCTLTVTYEDANEELKTLTKEFSINAMEMDTGMYPGMDPGYMDPSLDPTMTEPQGGFPWLWVGIGGGVVVIIGLVVTFKILKKRKEQKLLEEDDEDN